MRRPQLSAVPEPDVSRPWGPCDCGDIVRVTAQVQTNERQQARQRAGWSGLQAGGGALNPPRS